MQIPTMPVLALMDEIGFAFEEPWRDLASSSSEVIKPTKLIVDLVSEHNAN